jgi:hypothetical protein
LPAVRAATLRASAGETGRSNVDRFETHANPSRSGPAARGVAGARAGPFGRRQLVALGFGKLGASGALARKFHESRPSSHGSRSAWGARPVGVGCKKSAGFHFFFTCSGQNGGAAPSRHRRERSGTRATPRGSRCRT